MTDPRDLYGLPLERFVAERNGLAKTLRTEGDREGSARTARLRKPSVAAWAVNQLVRTQRGAVSELFEAGDQLQRVQSELLAGRGGAGGLREATDRVHDAVDGLTATAQGLLTSQGHELSPAVLERVRETLQAAALENGARSQVADGCLERELRHVGIGDGVTPPAPTERRSAKPDRGGRTSARPGEAKRRPAEQQAKREQAERLKATRQAADDARKAADRAGRELRAAQDRRDRALESLREAESALAGARERAEQAAVAHQRTQRDLKDVS